MKVCKFGGSSVADDVQVAKICDIILSDPNRKIVVVSAPGKRSKTDTKVTDLLIECAGRIIERKDAEEIIALIVERYAVIQRGLNLEADVLTEIEADLRQRAGQDISHPGMFMDSMKAAGEDNSARIVAAAFRARGAQASYVNPGKAGMLLTDEFGSAQLLDESYPLLRENLSKIEGLVIFPGFFGSTRQGAVATFPRGGSDITGAILAAALQADVYENFTDVDSVYPVDPRLVPEVDRGITKMTYREMRELSYAGFGVFHDEAVIPAVKAGIPINIRNTNCPDLPGTMVVKEPESIEEAKALIAEREDTGGIVGIASSGGFTVIYVDKYMMNREIGFGRRLLQILEEEGISYEHMPSGIDNVSVVIREILPEDTRARIRARVMEVLNPDCVTIDDYPHALIMVVGEQLYYTPGMAARATGALFKAGINIEMMNQGSSEISMMIGVNDADRQKAVRALYETFFVRRP